MEIPKELPAKIVLSDTNGSSLQSPESIATEKARLEKLYKMYERSNWGWAGQRKQVTFPRLGILTIVVMLSGTKYVEKNNGQLEKFDRAWFDKTNLLLDKLDAFEQSERTRKATNGESDTLSNEEAVFTYGSETTVGNAESDGIQGKSST